MSINNKRVFSIRHKNKKRVIQYLAIPKTKQTTKKKNQQQTNKQIKQEDRKGELVLVVFDMAFDLLMM